MYGLQVSVSLSANESMPGDPMTLRVQGEKGSCVCVAAVDKSLYLLKPDFQLSPDKVSFISWLSLIYFKSSVTPCCLQAIVQFHYSCKLPVITFGSCLLRFLKNWQTLMFRMVLAPPKTTGTSGGPACRRGDAGAPPCSLGTGTSPRMLALLSQ